MKDKDNIIEFNKENEHKKQVVRCGKKTMIVEEIDFEKMAEISEKQDDKNNK